LAWGGYEVEGEVPEPDGLPAADRGGVGVCLPGGGGDEPVLRGDGGVAARVWGVLGEFGEGGADPAGGGQEAERPGVVRHAQECLDLVPGNLQGLPRT